MNLADFRNPVLYRIGLKVYKINYIHFILYVVVLRPIEHQETSQALPKVSTQVRSHESSRCFLTHLFPVNWLLELLALDQIRADPSKFEK
jgi:hypothetical protein